MRTVFEVILHILKILYIHPYNLQLVNVR